MTEVRFSLLLSLLLLAINVAIYCHAAAATCLPTSKLPEGRTLWSEPLTTMTGRVLANVVGYIRLYGDQFTSDSYLPLKLNQATNLYQWAHEGFNNHQLTLAGECAVLALNYTRAGESIIYHNLTLHMRDSRIRIDGAAHRSGYSNGGGGGGSTGDWRQLCTFSPKFAFAHAKSKHYSCLEKRSHLCVANGELVAELVLERIKFETNVGENLFAEQTFDKPPLEESCSYW